MRTEHDQWNTRRIGRIKRDRRRDHIMAALLAVFGVAVAFGVGVVARGSTPPPVVAHAVSMDSSQPGMFRLQIAGDTLIGGDATATYTAKGYEYPVQAIPATAADYFIVNAEGPITTHTPTDKTKLYNYTAQPASVAALQKVGVKAVTLANNHAMDAGPAGLLDTITQLQNANITPIGAGTDATAAAKPLILTTPVSKIGIVSLSEYYGKQSVATADQPGVTTLSDDNIARSYAAAKFHGADRVIALVHWGDNYQPVNDAQRAWAVRLADAGFDLVVGHGPHVAQPMEVINGTPVFFSLGNYVMGTRGRFAKFGQWPVGLVLSIDYRTTGPTVFRLHCAYVDNVKTEFQPKTCDATHLAAAHQIVGPRFVSDGVSALTWSTDTLGRKERVG